MYINAFISEYSLPSKLQNPRNIETILKSHLLSNKTLYIPARSINTTEIGYEIYRNIDLFSNEDIKIAFGEELNKLSDYTNKYKEVSFKKEAIEVYKEFDARGSYVKYSPNNTIRKFNDMMVRCAKNEFEEFNHIFSNKKFASKMIEIGESGKFLNMEQYIEIIRKYNNDRDIITRLETHAKYFYNYFGARSINAGNTFSLENARHLTLLERDRMRFDKGISGFEIIIGSTIDIINNYGGKTIKDLDIDIDILDKLTYKNILDIRSNWLFDEVLEKYDLITKKCIDSYIAGKRDEYQKAITLLIEATEIKNDIENIIQLNIKSEVKSYNIFKYLTLISKVALSFSDISNIFSFSDIGKLITEVILDIKKQKVNNSYLDIKKKRMRKSIYLLEKRFNTGHPTIELIKIIKKKAGEI